jgi:hypothetical protein
MMTCATYLAVNAVLTALATAFMGARVFAKKMKRLPWSLDDTLLLAALVRVLGEPIDPTLIAMQALMHMTYAGTIISKRPTRYSAAAT